MNKKAIALGMLIGILCTILGTSLYLFLFTSYNLFYDITMINAEHILGKIIALGSTLNLIFFLIFLKLNKELVARGIVLSTLLVAIVTIFI